MFHHDLVCLPDKTTINTEYLHLLATIEANIIDFLSKTTNILIKNKPS